MRRGAVGTFVLEGPGALEMKAGGALEGLGVIEVTLPSCKASLLSLVLASSLFVTSLGLMKLPPLATEGPWAMFIMALDHTAP